MTQKIKTNDKKKPKVLVGTKIVSTGKMKVSVKDYFKKTMKDEATVRAFTRLAKK